MDLDELQSVQSRERQTDSLQQLRPTFYQDAAAFIQRLEAERDGAAERAADPWNSQEVGRLNDDIDTAKQTVEAIYERRVGKIVKMASLAAADMPTDEDGLTEEEQDLFETLVAAIEDNREGVFAVLDGESPDVPGTGVDESPSDAGQARGPSGTGTGSETTGSDTSPDAAARPDAGSVDDRQADAGVDAVDAMGGESSSGESPTGESTSLTSPEKHPEDAPSSGTDGTSSGSGVDAPAETHSDDDPSAPDGGTRAVDGRSEHATAAPTDSQSREDAAASQSTVDRATVRITDDVGEIFGVDDRAYDLTAEDVVVLPEANATPLVERDAAERLD